MQVWGSLVGLEQHWLGQRMQVQVLAAEYAHFNNDNNSRNNDNDKNAMAAQIQVHSMT